MNKTLQKKLDKLPQTPGVYLFLGKKKKILYIGKASNLKARVRSYFQTSSALSPAKHMMIDKIVGWKIQETDTEIEALLLEANLIKKYLPPFNVVMRDDKTFAYVKITIEEEFPTVKVVRKLDKTGRFFGPFTDMGALREALKVLRRIFKWRPEKCDASKGKPCFDFQLGRCPGTCIGKVDKKEYQRKMRQVIWFFEGKKERVLKDLKKQLRVARRSAWEGKVEQTEYQIMSIEKVIGHSKMLGVIEKYETDAKELARLLGIGKLLERIEGYDISNIFGREAVGSMVVFKEGEPKKSEYRKFKIILLEGEPNDVGMMKEMLERRFKRYHHKSKKDIWPIPDVIIVDGGKAQLNTATRALKKYKLDIPHISLAKRNEEIYFPGEKNPLKLPQASPALHLVQRVRDEAHRFAITYHRKRRSKRLFK